MTKISIITVTYNAAPVLQRTLDSVSRQTHPDIEHLIIDGASKDETLAITEAYRDKSTYDVIVQSEPDKGLYDAMNKGLHKATGDYLVFLNAGDTLYADDTLSLVAEKATDSPAVIYGDTAIVDNEGNFLHLRGCAHLNNFLGNLSVWACWYVIRHSMSAQTLPNKRNTTYNIATLPMLTGASE